MALRHDPRFLDSHLLERIRARAADHDRENSFFTEDLGELIAAGYLTAHIPSDLGGGGLTLAQLTREQRALAGAAPATALAVNMHQVWVAVAKIARERGESFLDTGLTEAAAGEILAFGISEPGNDLMLFGSTCDAAPDGEGGYRFTGTKIFTSLAPAWTRLGVFGADTTSPDAPKSVFAFVHRDEVAAGRVEILDDWDTLGQRASQSRTTLLRGAHAPAGQVIRRIDPGPSTDPLIFGIFASFEILLAAVYTGIAERALALAVQAAQQRTSRKNDGAPLAHDPDVRRRVAAAGITLDGVVQQVEALARNVDDQADHGDLWFPRLSALKWRATEVAREVVTASVQVAGGSAYRTGDELGRLYRDVLAGMFHPSSEDSAHGAMANVLLGPLPR
ncbi:acyl-CoA dehydrogenase family protein [Ruania halotolerans]|uniref:acyl-CoA dehydrogenase family protein n=1 Tax=Ruania halotolerans TaxID=2897773 RepID=UPI001E3BE6EC|nr:acyl-CoA dehydrogenase family protein [Ruania halotolerans]UFU05413.1 acyl-CoA/acyl-ACP dehydrogenase [Ruania halotolerans]